MCVSDADGLGYGDDVDAYLRREWISIATWLHLGHSSNACSPITQGLKGDNVNRGAAVDSAGKGVAEILIADTGSLM